MSEDIVKGNSYETRQCSLYFILTEIFGYNRSHEKLITIANRLSHTWEKPFHPIRNQLSERISQLANALTLFLAPLRSSFTDRSL